MHLGSGRVRILGQTLYNELLVRLKYKWFLND